MYEHLVIDGNAVYEIDIDCMQRMEKKQQSARGKDSQGQRGTGTKQTRNQKNYPI